MQRVHAYGILTAGLGLLLAVAAYLGVGGAWPTPSTTDGDQPRRAGLVSNATKEHEAARIGGCGLRATRNPVTVGLVADDAPDDLTCPVPADLASGTPTTTISGTQPVRAPPRTDV